MLTSVLTSGFQNLFETMSLDMEKVERNSETNLFLKFLINFVIYQSIGSVWCSVSEISDR